MTQPLRTVVVGYGKATRFYHAPITASTSGLALHGIATNSPEKQHEIESTYKCKSYLGLEAVLVDPEVDLVVLSTPNSTHAPMAVAALNAGKNVITEKVMCLSLAECDEMIGAAELSGKLLSVFQNRRWDGDFLTVRRLLNEGQLGTVRWIEMAWQRWDSPTGWRAEAQMGGGRFYDLGAHLLDQLLLLFPQDVQSVFCKKHYDFPNLDVESHALIVVNFVDGATGVIDLGSMAAIGKPRFHLFGDKATFAKHGLDPQDDAARAGDIDAATVEDEANFGQLFDGKHQITIPTIQGRWRSYYENIVDVLQNGAESAVKLHEARRVIGVLEAAMRSAREGRSISVNHE
ncbi:MAG: Gfo/Idh/MocA family oxidoreductase [Chloroflexota bacterium]